MSGEGSTVLTADLVRTRCRGDTIDIVRVDAKQVAEAEALAARILTVAAGCVGCARGELMEALSAIECGPKEVKLRQGLVKLALDAATFSDAPEVDYPARRSALFLAAAQARKAGTFQRDALIRAAELGEADAELRSALFGDLREQALLLEAPKLAPRALVASYDPAQEQALLLRAEKVQVRFATLGPLGLRHLFRKLKFLRLLYRFRKEESGYVLEVDGPMSLFGASTKYGLALAILLPTLRGTAAFELTATVMWKNHARYTFHLAEAVAPRPPEADISEEVAELLRGLQRLGEGGKAKKREKGDASAEPWSFAVSSDVLELDPTELIVPDILARRGETAVFVEVLGHWNRDAVFRRMELLAKGTHARIVFCASDRLRVRESAITLPEAASLYVYKHSPSAREVFSRIERMGVAAVPQLSDLSARSSS